jgi:tRNA dimethylallyltransferase
MVKDMKPHSLPPAICIMGPTASGKTDLAIHLLQHINAAIISVDSGQVYRGMDIGTAKPDQSTQARAPHRLIDIRDPSQSYSVSEFREDALREMAAITAEGRVPLLVGGTMLYFRALFHGLSALPAADEDVRALLEQEAQVHGWDNMHARLAAVDPQAAGRIHPNDAQRIQRALEVYELTGIPLSQLQAEPSNQAAGYRFIRIALIPSDRELMRERIAQRFYQMLEQGFIDEVKHLYQRGDLQPGLPAIRAVGYRQVWQYLTDELDYDSMVEKAINATRQFAKRQLTWLRSEPDLVVFDPTDNDLENNVLQYILEQIVSTQ